MDPRDDAAAASPGAGRAPGSFAGVSLETPRLCLRPLAPADVERVTAMLGDAGVMRFYPRVFTREEAERWLETQLHDPLGGERGLWLIIEKGTGEAVGQVSLVDQDVEGVRETEVGYLVASRHWRRGIATEAAGACRDHAFRSCDRARLVSLIRPENVASQGVARKIGMRPVRATTFAGTAHIVFAIERAWWSALYAGVSAPIPVR